MSESQSGVSRHDDDAVPQQVQVLEISQTEVPQGLTDDIQMQVSCADDIYIAGKVISMACSSTSWKVLKICFKFNINQLSWVMKVTKNKNKQTQKQNKTQPCHAGLADLNHRFKSRFKSTDFFIKISDLNQYFLFFFKLWTNQSCFG